MRYRNSKVNYLKLSGFQVFSDETYIPLSKITYIFGPNSSGKSSIYDALNLVQEIFYPTLVNENTFDDFRTMDWWELVSPHWRIQNLKRTKKMSLEIGSECNIDFGKIIDYEKSNEVFSIGAEETNKPESIISMKVDFIALERLSDIDTITMDKIFTYSVNGTEIITMIENVGVQINTTHPSLHFGLNYYCNVNELKDIFTKKEVSLENGWLTIGFPLAFHRNRRIVWQLFEESYSQDLEKLKKLSKVIRLIDEIVFAIKLATKFEIDSVNASRSIPTADLLTYYIQNNRDNTNINDTVIRPSLPISNDKLYNGLAKSVLNSINGHDDGIFSYVNRILSDNLFTDKGYQLTYDYDIIFSKYQFEALNKNIIPDLGKTDIIIRMKLVDENGVNHDFANVGSGIGYCFPILVKLAKQQAQVLSNPLLTYIQQPELHLHPLLQMQCADIFIEASSNKRMIIETHSEHLILRTLRRIKEASKKNGGKKKLSKDDVSILYFEPQLNGTTSVTRIQISDDGSFLNRWPNGFFDERYGEIFHE